MKPSLQKLQKFFKLEAERGYDNHAVLGGLDRMLDRWEAEARIDELPEDLIQAVVARVRDYPRLTPTSRAETLEGLWRRIQRSEGVPAGPRLAPPEEQEAPAPPKRTEARPAPRSAARPDASEGAQQDKTAPRQAEARPKRTPDLETTRPLEGAAAEVVQPATQAAAHQAKAPSEVDASEDEVAEVAEADGDDEFAALPGDVDEAGDESETIQRPALVTPLPPVEPAALSASVTVLPGVGPRHGQTLGRLGMQTLRDMLYYFPRRYDDYTKLKPINRLWYGEEVTVIGTVQSVSVRNIRSGRTQIVEAVIGDGSGALRVTWFNQAWVAKRLRSGMHVVLSGKIDQYLGRLVMNSPEWEPLEQQQLSTNRIVPVYPLTAQITQRWLRRLLNQVVTYWAPRVPDPLPADLRRSAGLLDLANALVQVHFPNTWKDLEAAQHRLAFDEIFLLQLGVQGQKRAWQARSARVFETPTEWLQTQTNRLPFTLTAAQQRALEDVRYDLAAGRPMNRLLQGDVGSGKTAVAALAIGMVVQHSAQAALMAPTAILAEQHYKSLLKMLASANAAAPAPASLPPDTAPSALPEGAAAFPTPDSQVVPAGPEVPAPTGSPEPLLQPGEIRLMVGATPEAEKRVIRAGLESGAIRLVIGTHALIEDPVVFKDLQLVIVDEQHRFGVEQRAALRAKGDNPHLLVMTATPIPRSLALTVHGDLDLTVIGEMPPGRQPVDTFVITPRERERAYTLIRTQVQAGRQAFIIYPLVEESDKSESKAAVEEHTRLQAEIFPKLKLGLLHGRMKPEEKDAVMARFRDGEYHVLISTSVVEVGVDVPNATVMLIEGANRFGLAQLHQFRGRVGRGADKSYCLLIPDAPDEAENERLQVMTETNDGFLLAERDLQQRGPGQFIGTRQSGYTELQLASLTDIRLIEKARRHAQALFEQDPDLSRPEHQFLAAALERFWSGGKTDIS